MSNLKQEVLARSDYYRGILVFIQSNPGCSSDDIENSPFANGVIPMGIRKQAVSIWIKELVKRGEIESRNWRLFPIDDVDPYADTKSYVLPESRLRSLIRRAILDNS
jgi:hypothetical protein